MAVSVCKNTSIPLINAKDRILNQMAGYASDENKEVVRGFLELMYQNNGTTVRAIRNATELPAKLSEYAEKYANIKLEEGDNVQSLMAKLEETPGAFSRLAWVAEQELQIAAGMNLNPAKMAQTLRDNKDFYNFYSNIYDFTRLNNKSAFVLMGNREIFGSKAQFYKEHGVANDMIIRLEGVNNKAKSYYGFADEVMVKLPKYFANKYDKVLSPDELAQMVKLLDPDNKDGSKILEQRLLDKLIEPERIDLAKAALNDYYNELQKFNYGDAGLDTRQLVDGYLQKNEGMTNADYFRELRPMYTPPKGLVSEEKIPSYLSFITTTGEDLTKLIVNKGRQRSIELEGGIQSALRLANNGDDRVNKEVLHKAEAYILEKFTNVSPDKRFQPKMGGYVPTSINDPLRELVTDNKMYKNVFTTVGAFEHASKNVTKDNEQPVTEDWRSGGQQFSHLITRISEFSSSLTNKIAMDKDFKSANPRSSRVIERDADRVIEEFNAEFNGNRVNRRGSIFRSFKNLTTSLIGVTATGILATAGIPNLIYGSIGLATRFGAGNVASLVGKYSSNLKSQGSEGEVARAVKQHLHWDAPVSTKTDDLMISKKMTVDKDGKIATTLDALARGAGKLSEWSANGAFLQMIPVFRNFLTKASFNSTENMLTNFNGVLLNDAMQSHMSDFVKRTEVSHDSQEFRQELSRALPLYENLAIVQTKEAIGNFSKYVKPVWAWKQLRDADTVPQVLSGAVASMAYMFKQVESLNKELMLRIMTSLGVSPSKKGIDIKRTLYNLTAQNKQASLLTGVGIIALSAVNEWLEDKDDVPVISLVQNADMTNLPKKVVKTLYGASSALLLNVPLDEKRTQDAMDILKWVSGVGFSNTGIFDEIYKDKDAFVSKLDASASFTDLLMDVPFDIADPDVSTREFKHRVYSGLSDWSRIPMIGPMFSGSNDNLKTLGNLVISAKGLHQLWTAQEGRDSAIAGEEVKKDLMKNFGRFFGVSVYFKPEHYENLYARSYDARNDYFDLDRFYNRSRYKQHYNVRQHTIADGLLNSMSKGYRPSIWNTVRYEAKRLYERGL